MADLILLSIGVLVALVILFRIMIIRSLNRATKTADAPASHPLVMPFLEPMSSHYYLISKLLTGRFNFLGTLIDHMPLVANNVDQGTKMYQYSYFNIINFITIYSPEALKDVLVKKRSSFTRQLPMSKINESTFGKSVLVLEGEDWKRHRRLVTPAFKYDHLKPFTPRMTKCGLQAINVWTEQVAAASGNKSRAVPVSSVDEVFSNFTLEVLTSCGFGFEMNALSKSTKEKEAYKNMSNSLTNPVHMFEWYNRLPLESNKVMYESIGTFKELTMRIIQEKRASISMAREGNAKNLQSGTDDAPSDLLDMLMSANENEDTADLPLTDEELFHNVNVFFIAGHDTSSSTLNSVLYCLSKNMAVQEKARQLVRDVVGDEIPDTLTYAQLEEMPYIVAVIKETMRFLPAAPLMIRRVTAPEVEIGGYTLHKGDICQLNTMGIHRDPDVWQDPLEFQPERFMPGGVRPKHPFAYLPFGAGQHQCVGMNFAMMEMRIIIPLILLHFEVTCDPTYEVELSRSSITMRPAQSFIPRLRPLR